MKSTFYLLLKFIKDAAKLKDHSIIIKLKIMLKLQNNYKKFISLHNSTVNKLLNIIKNVIERRIRII
jgi:hypothetical protein